MANEQNNFPLALVIKAVDEATAPLRRINARIAAAVAPVRQLNSSMGALAKEAGLPKLVAGFTGVGNAAAKVGSNVAALGKKIGAVALVAGAALAAVFKTAVDQGDKWGEQSAKLKMTADAYAGLEFAAEQADIPAETFATSMETLNKRMGEARAGMGPLAAFLKKTSPLLLEQLKRTKGNGEAFHAMMRALDRMPDAGKRAAIANAAFGRSGSAMALLVADGTGKILENVAAFERLHGPVADFVEESGKIDNLMRETSVAFTGVRNALVGALGPAFRTILELVRDLLVANREPLRAWAKQFGEELPGHVRTFIETVRGLKDRIVELAGKVGPVVEAMGGWRNVAIGLAVVLNAQLITSVISLGAQLGQLTWAIGRTAFSLGALAFGPVIAAVGNFIVAIRAGYGVMAAFNLVLAANPIGVVIMAIAALAAAAFVVYKNWEPIKTFFVDLWSGITNAVTKAWEKIKPVVDAMGGVMGILTNPVGAIFKGAQFGYNKLFGDEDRPMLGAARAAPPPTSSTQRTEATVNVNLNNAPKGTKAEIDRSSSAPVDLSVGYALVTP